MSRLLDAYNDARDTAALLAGRTIGDTRQRLYSGADGTQETHEGAFDAWARLLSGPYIEHRYGRSFQRPGCATCRGAESVFVDGREMTCPTCAGTCYNTSIEVGDGTSHLDGVCFECSGARPPDGMAQDERRSRRDALAGGTGLSRGPLGGGFRGRNNTVTHKERAR